MTPGQLRYVPYEIKETTIKNFLGIFLMGMFNFFFGPAPYVYSLGSLVFASNWVYTIIKYMSNAVTRVDLHEDGKHVTLTFKTGGTSTANIKDIMKKQHEKELVQTFEECYLFPIQVKSGGKAHTYYLYGSGQEAIKNGEIFRAIINGQAIRI